MLRNLRLPRMFQKPGRGRWGRGDMREKWASGERVRISFKS